MVKIAMRMMKARMPSSMTMIWRERSCKSSTTTTMKKRRMRRMAMVSNETMKMKMLTMTTISKMRAQLIKTFMVWSAVQGSMPLPDWTIARCQRRWMMTMMKKNLQKVAVAHQESRMLPTVRKTTTLKNPKKQSRLSIRMKVARLRRITQRIKRSKTTPSSLAWIQTPPSIANFSTLRSKA